MDPLTYLKFIAALSFVLGLIGVCVWLARRFNILPDVQRIKKDKRRMEIIESLPLDPKRRMMIVRRDDKEVVLILGATNEIIVETDLEHVPTVDVKDLETKSGTGATAKQVAENLMPAQIVSFIKERRA